jgi:hypothetical protein
LTGPGRLPAEELREQSQTRIRARLRLVHLLAGRYVISKLNFPGFWVKNFQMPFFAFLAARARASRSRISSGLMET